MSWSAALGLAATGPVDFIRQVKPILARRCFPCHGPETSESGLRLDGRESATAPLDSGLRAVVPGDAAASELIARVSADDPAERMPPEGNPLSPHEVDVLRQWIAAGAEWREHWAFQPIAPQQPPAVKDRRWPLNPIDAFVLAKLEAAGLAPAAPADRRTLIRRAYYNLTGLPPTLTEVEAFERDESPDAWERLVDRLLESPRYGEHWARHWLDVVRYAETNSFERDGAKPNAWKYRDYVIRSFNEDKPYDQFVKEQLAGDEIAPDDRQSVIATGYYRLGLWDDEPADPEQARADEIDDWVSTTGQAFLGLTVGCARCHDHKIDPIPQVDYYGLAAFFADVTPYGDRGDATTNNQWLFGSPEEIGRLRELSEREAEIEREKVSMEEAGIKRMSAADQRRSETPERQALLDEKLQKYLNPSEWELYQQTVARQKQIRAEREALPPPDAALGLAKCDPCPPETHLFERGNPHVPGEVVAPHFPALFKTQPPAIAAPSLGSRSAGRRRVLADWIASPDNMLTARVIVNRVWQHHFGRGIVRSANNFGELGDPPTHPELLDWLARWFVEHGWRLKPLHRLIMTSRTYQMSCEANRAALSADPTNDLLWRFDMRRLSAEEIRDSTLQVAGALTERLYGASVYPKMSAEVLATQSVPGLGWGESSPEDQNRRSVYIHVKRSLLPPLLTAFDLPDVDSSCEARFVTTQPQQALAMLNGEFARDQALRLAARIESQGARSDRERVAAAYRLTLGREAHAEEIDEGAALMQRLREKCEKSPQEALVQLCLVPLNLNEFLYLP
jgi:hypothetical protein